MTERTETTTDVPQTGWQRPELSEELLAEVKLHTAGEGQTVYTRVHNGLLNAGVRTKEDILRMGRAKLLQQPNLGVKTLMVIGKIVGEHWAPRPLHAMSTDTLIAELRHRGYTVKALKQLQERQP